MAEDCVCSALNSIYSMQSDLLTQIVSRFNVLTTTVNNKLKEINNTLIDLDSNLHADLQIMQSKLQNIHADLNLIKNSIDNKELCVSNETIVESPLSTFVSKAKLEVDE